MPAIDPAQLLKALSPLLAPDGAIKGPTEVSRIVSLMRDSAKLVSRCIYVNILKGTKAEETLEQFISQGGWDILNTWLQDCKDMSDNSFLMELLKVYQRLPVSVDLLKKNQCAKTIKSYAKSDDKDLKTLSSVIVDRWMQKIRTTSNTTEKTKKKDDRKDKEKEKDKDKDKDKEKRKDKEDKHDRHKHKERSSSTSHHHHHHHHKDSSHDNTSSSNSAEQSTNSSGLICDNSDRTDDKSDDLNDKEIKKRPKTVKTFASKFRSTGLEEAPSLPGKKKLTPPTATSVADSIPKPTLPKRPAVPADTPPEKKSRLTLMTPLTAVTASHTTEENNNASPSPTEEMHGKIKLITARPKSTKSIVESTGFMDDITRSSSSTGVIRRRKRSNSATGGRPSISPTSANAPNATSPTTSPLTSPTTAKLTRVPSFYRETLPSEEENQDENSRERTPSPVDEILDAISEDKENVKMENGDIQDLEKMNDDDSSTNSSATVEYDGDMKGVLTGGATIKKKAKKKVHWPDPNRMEEYFYFEMDDTERENVNKKKTFDDMKKSEMVLDRRAMENAKRLINDNMAESMIWKRPPLMDGIIVLATRGCNSTEKNTQKNRESGVLQALFFSKTMLPDSPAEADLEPLDIIEPKIVPLEDENAGTEEFQYSYDNTPQQQPHQLPHQPMTPQFNQQDLSMLPPEMQNLIIAIQQGGPIPHIDMSNPVMASMQSLLGSIMNDNPQNGLDFETIQSLKQILGPIKDQILGSMNASQSGNMGNGPPGPMQGQQMMGGPPMMGGPMQGQGSDQGFQPNMMGPGPNGPLQNGPPGMMQNGPPGPHGPGQQGPPGPHGPGPHGQQGPQGMQGGPHGPQGPSGPRGMFQQHGPPGMGRGGEEWGDNMMGGGHDNMRGRGLPGFRGRGGPRDRGFNRGRGGPRGRGGRSNTICRHFAAGSCMRGDSCNFAHPRNKGHS